MISLLFHRCSKPRFQRAARGDGDKNQNRRKLYFTPSFVENALGHQIAKMKTPETSLLPQWLNSLICFFGVGFPTKNDEETKRFRDSPGNFFAK